LHCVAAPRSGPREADAAAGMTRRPPHAARALDPRGPAAGVARLARSQRVAATLLSKFKRAKNPAPGATLRAWQEASLIIWN
jgi:hypothetical protein